MRDARRKGQSGVETMMLTAMVVTVLLGMMHLFQVTWAAQNRHMRAREAVLHDLHYLGNYAPRDAGVTVIKTPSILSSGVVNYEKAGIGAANKPVGAAGTFEFRATARDATREDSFGRQEIEVTAVICSDCPPQP